MGHEPLYQEVGGYWPYWSKLEFWKISSIFCIAQFFFNLYVKDVFLSKFKNQPLEYIANEMVQVV